MKRSTSKRQFYGDKRIGGMSRYDRRAAKVTEMRAKIAANTADVPHKFDAAFNRMLDAVTPRRTPAQLTSQADLDGQSEELGGMCESDR